MNSELFHLTGSTCLVILKNIFRIPALFMPIFKNSQAVAIHSTSYVNVKGNVAFDIIGHMSGTQLA